MNRVVKVLLVLVVVGGLGAAGWALRGGGGGAAVQGERACGTLDTPAAGATVPTGLTLAADQKLLDVQTQGKTTLVRASMAGTREEVVQARDAIAGALAGQGWTQTSTDQEPGYEAEAQFGGAVEGSLRVRPLCEGRLEIRYTIRG